MLSDCKRAALAVCLLLLGMALPSTATGVITLTNTNFDDRIASGTWLLDFYAPWCGHCKQLAPVLDELAAEVGSKLNIGTVDATAEKTLANRFDIKGFPTLMVASGGNVRPYSGARSLDALRSFAERMSGPPVSEVSTQSQVDAKLKQEDVIFLLAAKRSLSLLSTYREVAIQKQDSLTFLSTQHPSLLAKYLPAGEKAALLKLEANEEPVSLPIASDASVDELVEWVSDNRWPLLPELGGHNFRALSRSGRRLVIACVDPQNEDSAQFLASVRRLARASSGALPAATRKAFHWGWLDAVRWSSFIGQFGIGSLPRAFVLDAEASIFFYDEEVDEEDELQTFLQDVVAGLVPAQRESYMGVPGWVLRGMRKHWYISVPAVVGFVALLVWLCMLPAPDDSAIDAAVAREFAEADAKKEKDAAAAAAAAAEAKAVKGDKAD